VSLLSDLIAELSALIERSRESRTQLSSANDQLEQVFDVIKESTVGSASAQVTEGLGRLRNAASKLEEAKRLLAAGAEDRNDPAVAGTALTGMRWGAALLGPNAEPGRNLTGAFGKRRLAIALHDLIEHLPHRLNIATGAKPGPLDVVPVPQQTNPPSIRGTERLESLLSRVASRHAGVNPDSIAVRLGPTSVVITQLTAGAEARLQPVVPLAQAPTLEAALAQLDRPSTPLASRLTADRRRLRSAAVRWRPHPARACPLRTAHRSQRAGQRRCDRG
jgi:hypothetical protein